MIIPNLQWKNFTMQWSRFLTNPIDKFEKILGLETGIRWYNATVLISHHVVGFFWCCLYAFPAKWQTVLFAYLMYSVIGTSGILCGVHRMWTHRSYKAKLPLRIYLMLAYASTGQNSIYDWVRDHRVHHKYSDTAADPHNASRGLWFSHIGWLCMKKNAQVIEKGRQMDMSDIESDPVVMFERKYKTPLSLVLCYFLPTLTSVLLWGETWQCAVAWQCFIRVLVQFHAELSVNSFAHIYGYKPYNQDIKPTENPIVSAAVLGEGWHNYHHTFPWDCKAAENVDFFNLGAIYIKLFAKLGLAYDLKEPSLELIRAVMRKQFNVEE